MKSMRSGQRVWLWIPLAGICFAIGSGPAAAATADERVDFNFQIRPLLSDRCFKCHGPDEKSRKAKLRLDRKEGIFLKLKEGGEVVVPGHPEQSEMIRRITHNDPKEKMPPPESNLALSPTEIERIRQWIQEGAEVKPHWSFIPPAPVRVPPLEDAWIRNPIDAFVLKKIRQEGLAPSPEADQETLIRRMSLDLTGLPPTLEQIDAFLADQSAGACDRLVDQLLDSPAYGERMANDWLDLARFADTYGYQADVDRDMSPWRDWVVQAFNQNLPYDQFITWQIAGDLLPHPTRDQILATAFNRLHRQTNEGGSIEEEFRTEYVADRVQTVGAAFLGLTLQCCRCHDHKFDPVTQKDFYRVFGYFNNIDESGLYSHFTRATPTPTLLLYGKGEEEKHASLLQKIDLAEKNLRETAQQAEARFEAWRQQPAPLDLPDRSAAFPFDQILSNRTENVVRTNAPAVLVDNPELMEGVHGKAIRFSGDNELRCPGSGVFGRTDPFSFDLWIRPAALQERAVLFHRSRAWTDSASRGYELLLENGRPSFALIHFWPGNALRVRARDSLPANEWTRLTITYDGSSRAAGVAIFRNGKPLALEVARDSLYKDILHRREWGDADADQVELTLGGRFRDAGFKNGAVDELQIFDRCLTPLEIRLLTTGRSDGATAQELRDYYLARVDAEYRNRAAELHRLRAEENRRINDVPEIMVMKELAQRRPAFVLKRGSYDAPGEKVEPGVPEAIFPMPTAYPTNRLGLARWLVNPGNPLTARVAVNRVWALHFGRGIVATVADFGSQGALPTHPQLLDWLANWFVQSGWDRKALHRLIVTSETYRQRSEASPGLLAADPENRYLARGPKHRLDAEQIRDSTLAACGLLERRLGGPSVKPYQPAGLWEESGTGKTYVQDKGAKLYRRSLYTFWRRTSPPPTMLAFDAPSREVCLAKREITTTPMQALVLMDDPQFVEAAHVLGEKLVRECGANVDLAIVRAFRIFTSRRPSSAEESILRQLYQEQLALFAAQPKSAEKFLATGEWPRDRSLPAPQVAANAVLASTLMNYDDFVMQR